MTLAARIEGIGVVGPGLADWGAAREVLAGRAARAAQPTVLPSPEALPANERRRAGKGVRLALGAGLAAVAAAGRDAKDLASVFASSAGDGDNVHAICEVLASEDREISPTRFHNSVHNAPQGYWSIATGSMHPADSLAAYDATFGAGLLEALGRLHAEPGLPVLLVAYDVPYPPPLRAFRPIPEAFAVALCLAHPQGARRGPLLRVATTQAQPTRMEDVALEALRTGIPAARALPLLQLLARGAAGTATLEYAAALALAVEVAP